MSNLGLAHALLGDQPKAAVLFQQRFQLCAQHGFIENGEAIIGTAALAAQHGWDEDAAVLRSAAAAMGYPPSALDAPIAERIDRDFLAPARHRFGDLAWREAEDSGRALSREQAVARALVVVSSLINAEADRFSQDTRTPRLRPADAPAEREAHQGWPPSVPRWLVQVSGV